VKSRPTRASMAAAALDLGTKVSFMSVCLRASRVARLLVIAAVSAFLAACSASGWPPAVSTKDSPSPSVPSPATSGIDRTVLVRWQLADSFDVMPDGKCAGRSIFSAMHDGVRVQLIGSSSGFGDETRATAHFERRPASPSDDGQYCIIEAVFAPSLPDPEGYSIKFAGSRDRARTLGRPGGSPLGQPEPPPGYGYYNLGSQSCPSLLDPPERACPVPAD
jgi:hypothetical protein